MPIVEIDGIGIQFDPADADLTAMHWRLHQPSNSGPQYAVYYTKRAGIRRRHYLHRIVVARMLGRELEQGECVDHIDCNSLNNLRTNLRTATVAQNNYNIGRRHHNKSGYKGVTQAPSGRWVSHIRAHGTSRYLGTYDTPQEAHEAYKVAALEAYGEFANYG